MAARRRKRRIGKSGKAIRHPISKIAAVELCDLSSPFCVLCAFLRPIFFILPWVGLQREGVGRCECRNHVQGCAI
jgi:hypothetical protein